MAFGMEANARLSPPGGSHRAARSAFGAVEIGPSTHAEGSAPQLLMSDDDRPDITPATKPRLKRLRFAAILCAVLVLGLISFVFGMFVVDRLGPAVADQVLAVQGRAQLHPV